MYYYLYLLVLFLPNPSFVLLLTSYMSGVHVRSIEKSLFYPLSYANSLPIINYANILSGFCYVIDKLNIYEADISFLLFYSYPFK